MHDYSSPFSVLFLPDKRLQWPILVFLTCHHHRRSFSQRFLGVFASRPTTRPATSGRAFSLHGAIVETTRFATPYGSSMLLLHIRMLSFIFRSPVACDFSLFVRCTWQASTGFRRVGESDSTALLHFRLYLMLKP